MKKSNFIIYIFIVFSIIESCVSHDLGPADCSLDNVTLQVVRVEDADCTLKDGVVEVMATTTEEGPGNFQFRIGDGAYQDEPVFTNLAAGTYEVTVANESGCTKTVEASVKNKNGVNIEIVTSDAGCGSSEGEIVVEPVGGTPPYSFSFNGGGFQENNIFTNLPRGEYTVTGKDATGCEVKQAVRIRSGVRFSSTISSIIQNNCAINDCHNGSQFPDLRQFSVIKQNASRIREQVVSRNMPQEGSLTQSQIDAIACWVDDGAPDN